MSKSRMFLVEDNNWITETTLIDKSTQILTDDYYSLNGLCLFAHSSIPTAKSGVPLHYHENCYEVTIILKGCDSITVSDERFSLSGGDILITPPGVYHKSTYFYEDVHEQIWFQINPNVEHFLNLDAEMGQQFARHLKSLGTKFFSVGNDCLLLAKKCFSSFLNQENSIKTTSEFIYLFSQILFAQNNKFSNEEKVKLIKNYICTHLSENITIENICEVANVSRSWLHQNFKKQTPSEYINYQRIKASIELLKTDMSITDIAFSLGFGSSSYFSTVFKKYKQITPKQYRYNINHNIPAD